MKLFFTELNIRIINSNISVDYLIAKMLSDCMGYEETVGETPSATKESGQLFANFGTVNQYVERVSVVSDKRIHFTKRLGYQHLILQTMGLLMFLLTKNVDCPRYKFMNIAY